MGLNKKIMNTEELKQILNDILNDAICSPKKIKRPNSNEIGKFVNEWMEKSSLLIKKVDN